MAEIKYIIPLDPRTKKNHQMIAGKGEKCPKCKKPKTQFIRQGKAHDEYAERAVWYLLPRPPRPIDCEINIKCLFYMQTKREVDGLNLLAMIDDLLVETGIIKDDNSKIVIGHDGSRVYYDKDNPRTEITITKIPADKQMSLIN